MEKLSRKSGVLSHNRWYAGLFTANSIVAMVYNAMVSVYSRQDKGTFYIELTTIMLELTFYVITLQLFIFPSYFVISGVVSG